MYEIGQIVYGLLSDKQMLLPLKVIEEITIKNLEKETTTYKVLIPSNKLQKVNLNKFDKVFKSTEQATNFLYEKAKKAVDDLVLNTLEIEEEFFLEEVKDVKHKEDLSCNKDKNNIKIDIGDGIKANINIDNVNKFIEPSKIETEIKLEKSTNT